MPRYVVIINYEGNLSNLREFDRWAPAARFFKEKTGKDWPGAFNEIEEDEDTTNYRIDSGWDAWTFEGSTIQAAKGNGEFTSVDKDGNPIGEWKESL